MSRYDSFRTYMAVAFGLSLAIFVITWAIGGAPQWAAIIAIAVMCNFVAGYVVG